MTKPSRKLKAALDGNESSFLEIIEQIQTGKLAYSDFEFLEKPPVTSRINFWNKGSSEINNQYRLLLLAAYHLNNDKNDMKKLVSMKVVKRSLLNLAGHDVNPEVRGYAYWLLSNYYHIQNRPNIFHDDKIDQALKEAQQLGNPLALAQAEFRLLRAEDIVYSIDRLPSIAPFIKRMPEITKNMIMTEIDDICQRKNKNDYHKMNANEFYCLSQFYKILGDPIKHAQYLLEATKLEKLYEEKLLKELRVTGVNSLSKRITLLKTKISEVEKKLSAGVGDLAKEDYLELRDMQLELAVRCDSIRTIYDGISHQLTQKQQSNYLRNAMAVIKKADTLIDQINKIPTPEKSIDVSHEQISELSDLVKRIFINLDTGKKVENKQVDKKSESFEDSGIEGEKIVYRPKD